MQEPSDVLCAESADVVQDVLREAEAQCVTSGCYAAGFVSYEAAPGFDGCLSTKPGEGVPAAWFGLFKRVAPASPPKSSFSETAAWRPDETKDEYIQKIDCIQNLIGAGDTYQTNYTIRAAASCQPEDLYHLLDERNGKYGALIRLNEWTILSGSPELFFGRQGVELESKPMKGTRPRGKTLSEDKDLVNELAGSEKDKAENLMIVDMVRNDFGRIAEPGSVQVSGLFDIETYSTIHQMVSTVRCRSSVKLDEVFRALFPPASITGAPKRRAMEIISELESASRGVYTGSIGLIRPDGSAQFNVAIRTATVNERTGHAVYGIGGGIVWDSEPEREWDECWTKAKALTSPEPEFELLETMRWDPECGFYLLERHLSRMAESAAYFRFAINRDILVEALYNLMAGQSQERRIRLKLDRSGHISVEDTAMPPRSYKQPLVSLASKPIDSANRLLYHKTTCRDAYDEALASCPGCDDAILWNERHEITESTIANVAIQIGGRLYTPPISSGLLAGTLRAEMIDRGAMIEKVLMPDDLVHNDGLFLLNSVRGVYQVQYYLTSRDGFM